MKKTIMILSTIVIGLTSCGSGSEPETQTTPTDSTKVDTVVVKVDSVPTHTVVAVDTTKK